jgi:hypothetical protein
MLSRPAARLSYANVMATVADFVALGGSSNAAMTITGEQIEDNSVASADVRNNSVRGKDMRRGTVRSSDIRDSSLLARHLMPGRLQGSHGEPGPTGARGPEDQREPPGPKARRRAVPAAPQGPAVRRGERPGAGGRQEREQPRVPQERHRDLPTGRRCSERAAHTRRGDRVDPESADGCRDQRDARRRQSHDRAGDRSGRGADQRELGARRVRDLRLRLPTGSGCRRFRVSDQGVCPMPRAAGGATLFG